jgi:hypothetical protein
VSNSKVTKEQALEWLENPVTIIFRGIAQEERAACAAGVGVDCFHPFQPERTQEIMCALNAAVDTWDQVLDSLDPESVEDAFDRAEEHSYEE